MASGNQMAKFTAGSNQPPSSNPAVQNTRNNTLVLEFDPSTNQDAIFRDALPGNYSGGGLTVTIIWAAATATTGDCVWLAQFERALVGTDTIASDSFASTQTATTTTNGTSGVWNSTSITFTNGAQMDSIAVNETYRLKVTRNAAAAGDTMAGLAQLATVIVKET